MWLKDHKTKKSDKIEKNNKKRHCGHEYPKKKGRKANEHCT